MNPSDMIVATSCVFAAVDVIVSVWVCVSGWRKMVGCKREDRGRMRMEMKMGEDGYIGEVRNNLHISSQGTILISLLKVLDSIGCGIGRDGASGG